MQKELIEHPQPLSGGRHWTATLALAFTILFFVLCVTLFLPLPYPPTDATAWLYATREWNLFAVCLFPLPLGIVSGIALYQARIAQWSKGRFFASIGLFAVFMGFILDVGILIPLIRFMYFSPPFK